MMKGKLIVIEGTDGSGKATQTAKLIEKLTAEGIAFSTYDFPRYDTFWGKHVGRFLNGDFGKDVNPHLRVLPFLLDQADASNQIRKDLKKGLTVVCNRYTTANNLYQTPTFDNKQERLDYAAWLDDAAYRELKIVRPDLVIGLYVDPAISQKLIDQKGQRSYTSQKKDINEANTDLQQKVAAELLRLCTVESNWRLVNCMRNGKVLPIETIASKVWESVQSHFRVDN